MTTDHRQPGPAAAGGDVDVGQSLHVRRRGPAVWLTLSRPEAANALSRALVEALARAIDEVHADPAVRAVVVTGEGRTFCAGADLKERRAMSLDETRSFL